MTFDAKEVRIDHIKQNVPELKESNINKIIIDMKGDN
jgi:hypothetical protein